MHQQALQASSNCCFRKQLLCDTVNMLQAPVSWQTRRLQVPVAGRNGSAGSKTCMAEDQCISKHCGRGYDHTSQKFPYSVNYTKWAWEGEDVFDFRVCSAFVKGCRRASQRAWQRCSASASAASNRPHTITPPRNFPAR